MRYEPSLQRIVAATGRASAALTVAFAAGEAAATFARRGGFVTRTAGGATTAFEAAETRDAAARTLSGCTRDGGALPASGAAFRLRGGVGVRWDEGTTAAGRGGGGELAGSLSAGADAGAGGVGVAPDCAAAEFAAAKSIMDATILMDVMVSPSWCCCTSCSSWR